MQCDVWCLIRGNTQRCHSDGRWTDSFHHILNSIVLDSSFCGLILITLVKHEWKPLTTY